MTSGLLPPAVKAKNPVNLTWWHWAGYHVQFQKQLSDLYQKQYDSNVTLVPTAYSSYDQARAAIKAALASGSGPDIVCALPGSDLIGYVTNNQLVSFTDSFKKDPNWQNSFYPVSNQLSTVNGEVWAVTALNNAIGIWYNKTLLAKHNVAVPTSIDELKKAGDTLRAANVVPLTLAGGQDITRPAAPFYWLAAGLGYSNAMRQADLGLAPWTGKEMVQVMTAYQDVVNAKVYPNGVLGLKEQDEATLLVSGKSAMSLCGCWLRTTLKSALQPGTELGFAMLPAVTTGGKQTALPSVGLTISTNRGSPNRDIVFEMAAFVTGTAGKALYAGGVGIPPSGPLPADTAKEVATKVNDPVWGEVLDVQGKATGLRHLLTAQVEQALGEACQAMLSGKGTPESVLATVEAASKAAGARNFKSPDWTLT